MKKNHKDICLGWEEFYNYLTGAPDDRPDSNIEAHLSACPRCRKELAEALRLLNPEADRPSTNAQAPSHQEIRNTLSYIQTVARHESKAKRRYRWGSIAAAILLSVGLGSFLSLFVYVRVRSQILCNQARSFVQEVYEARSPSDLRLDLPFKAEATRRNSPDFEEAYTKAEVLFNQALGVRSSMSEALLGLGYIDLQKNRFQKAEKKFQMILNGQPNNLQAMLGRGVSRFEEGLASEDVTARDNYLRGALVDFENVLKRNAMSAEAQYNRIQVLYNTGRRKEALEEIERYLSRDPNSIWALKLRDLKLRIQLSRSEFLNSEIHRAALARDSRILENLLRFMGGKVTTVVLSLLRRALALENITEAGMPDSEDLRWAAGALASLYQTATADSCAASGFRFYAGLSPPQRTSKKNLDARLEKLIRAFEMNDFQTPLSKSEYLIQDFAALKDHWQLARTYQLRGSCFFYGETDFVHATAEFQKMMRHSELAQDPDLMARSLGALSSSHIEQLQYGEALKDLTGMKDLAQRYAMDSWNAFACNIMGNLYLRLGQLEKSQLEYLSGLRLAYRLMDADILLQTLENLAVVSERKEQFIEARDLYSQAEKWLQTSLSEGTLPWDSKTQARRLNLLYKQGQLALRLEDGALAKRYFQEALAGQPAGMRELEARNRLGLALAHIGEKNYSEAEIELREAHMLALKNGYPDILWQAESLQGFILEQHKDFADAIRSYKKAAEILEKMKGNVPSIDLLQTFFSHRYAPHRKVVSLLYSSMNDARQAMEYADRAKAMALRESLARNPCRAEAAKLPSAPIFRLDPLEPLPKNIAILEYFLSLDEIIIFVSGSARTDTVSVRMPLDELEVLTQQYVEAIRNNADPSFKELSRKLYQILILPVLPWLESHVFDTLVVLPDGPLHRIPFHCLMDSKGNHLLKSYAVSYAPSRSILTYILKTSPDRRISRNSSILLLDGSSSLPGASGELAGLSSLYSRNRLWKPVNVNATAPEIGHYDMIHFSGHAILQGGQPRLVFKTAERETYLDASLMRKWNLRNSLLVTLAGCNTGIGPIFDGETPWGLVPGLLSAGCPSILVSLFPVEDAATGKLTLRFYELLAQGSRSKAQCLRIAQLEQFESAATDSPPMSWCPFVLIGDPR